MDSLEAKGKYFITIGEVNSMKKLVITFGMLMALASLAAAADKPSLERGKELFSSTRLGTNGKSCASCHPGGNRLAQAAGYAEGKLAGIINACITQPLKGTALDPASNEMKSLIMYIRTFAKQEK
jgi:cytochrome c553